jgi:hypothetical protein
VSALQTPLQLLPASSNSSALNARPSLRILAFSITHAVQENRANTAVLNQIRHRSGCGSAGNAFCSGEFGILSSGPMRILFAISLLALAALLWASVSIAQHIYRSRRRHRTASRGSSKPLAAVPPVPADSNIRTREDAARRKAS